MSDYKLLTTSGANQEQHPLPLDTDGAGCSLRLRCLPGASALHLVVVDRDGVRLRAEVPAEGGEAVQLALQLEKDVITLRSPGRHVLTLPTDQRYQPPPPLVPSDGPSLDLALMIDGTTRHFFLEDTQQARRVTSRHLLQDPQLWSDEVERLTAFTAAATEIYPDCRTSILSFGDHSLENTAAEDLQARYLLYPPHEDSRALKSVSREQIQGSLTAIPATSGGDFVDAVADALQACIELRWRPEARKLVVVFGDSPGHSLLYPALHGGDAVVRDLDVDQQALRLHERGVELMTIYYAPPSDMGLQDISARQQLLSFARRQYRRLASVPQLAFEASSFNPEIAAQRLAEVEGPIARGPAGGELLEIMPTVDHEAVAEG